MGKVINWPTCTGGQFAEVLGVTSSLVSQWADAGMPCGQRNGKGSRLSVDPRAALPWVMRRREPPGSSRERLAKEQADKVALENAAKRAELAYVSHVEEILVSLAADLGAQLDALPGRCAGELAGLTEPGVIRARLLEETRGIRAAVADAVTKLAEPRAASADDGGNPETAEESDGGGVGE